MTLDTRLRLLQRLADPWYPSPLVEFRTNSPHYLTSWFGGWGDPSKPVVERQRRHVGARVKANLLEGLQTSHHAHDPDIAPVALQGLLDGRPAPDLRRAAALKGFTAAAPLKMDGNPP